MKVHRSERHRLTTLQKQLMKWLKNEGGGALRADQLFTTLVRNHQTPGTDPSLLAERMYDAVDHLIRQEYLEVRLESERKQKPGLSLYDVGSAGKELKHIGDQFVWQKGECPVVALTDEGLRYSSAI